MSIRDAKLILSSAQTICATAAYTQTISTNLIDLGAEDLAIGAGTPLYLNIRASSAYTYTVGSTGTLAFKLMHDTGSTFVDTGPALCEKVLTISEVGSRCQDGNDGWIMRQAIPGNTKRYLRLKYQRGLDASTAFTAADFNAWISAAVPETDVGT